MEEFEKCLNIGCDNEITEKSDYFEDNTICNDCKRNKVGILIEHLENQY